MGSRSWVWLLIACACAGNRHAQVEVVQALPASPVSSAPTVHATREAPREEVLAFCERYRTALEARDADALMALVSPRYDDDGTTYATLASSMKRLVMTANQIRYEIRYGDITTRPDGTLEVAYQYTASFLTAAGWQHRVGDADLVLERHGASFRILKGM